jgi:hypothetical protein
MSYRVVLVGLLWALGAQAEERVVLPLSLWDRVQAALKPATVGGPEEPWCSLERRLEGRLQGGVLSATLDVRLEVLQTEGWLDVPILDSAASLVSVRVDGAAASLRADDEFYVLGVPRPGVYHVQVRFLRGGEGDEFDRSIEVALPVAGPTHVSILVPEVGIDATLESGVVTSRQAEGRATRLVGEVNGPVSLAWDEAVAQDEVPLRLAAEQVTLLTVEPAIVAGQAQFEFSVEEGETDRLELQVPKGVEVLTVEGEEVQQWRVEPTPDGAPGRLVVLLTHLVSEGFQLGVGFQYAVEGVEVPLRVPSSPVATEGSVGVLAATGLEVELVGAARDAALPAGEVPGALSGMSPHPLHFAFRLKTVLESEVRLGVRRQAGVALTGTIVDDLEATTMVLEDGTEISKVRLFMRNNTRQYLGLLLPEGATLTHALLDGHPLHPAVERKEARERLLVPLQQSTQAGQRFHRVQPGENLGAIAYIHYSNPGKWPLIVEENNLAGPDDVQPGQQLRIPAQAGVEVEESRFVFEFAWRRQRSALGAWGSEQLRLPELDVDILKATWHVFLPHSVVPLRFESNLTAYSAVRYDPFRRLGMFIRHALVGEAQADPGGDDDEDEDAAAQGAGDLGTLRAALHQAEATAAADVRVGLGAFPLVGERYRFRRLLLGSQTPEVMVHYLARSRVAAIHWATLAAGILIAFITLRPRSGLGSGVVGLLLLAPLLVVGHHVVGVHRHLVWGLDLGLALLMLRHLGRPLWAQSMAWLRTPRLPEGLFRLRTAVLALCLWVLLRAVAAFPLFVSLAALVVLTLTWIRARQRPELRHV